MDKEELTDSFISHNQCESSWSQSLLTTLVCASSHAMGVREEGLDLEVWS